MNRMTRIASLVVVVALSLMPRIAAAQEALPSGKSVLEKYIEVTGGRANYEKVKSRVTTAKMEAPDLNIKGVVVITQLAPDLGSVHTNLDGIGVVEQGSNGTIVWEKSAMMGPRLLEGPERESLVRSLTINSELYPEKYYKSIETVAVEDVGGKPAYKVEIEANNGSKETRYYDKESGLLVKASTTAKTQMGDLQVSTTTGDYRDVDGIKMPFSSTQEMMQRKISVNIEKVEQNVDVPMDKFALPPDVKALADKAAAAPATAAPTTQPEK